MKKKANALVNIFMGSDSDYPVMEEAVNILKQFGVEYEVHVSSAHRSPERTRRLIKKAEREGVQVFIAGAGAAAHLAGVIAAETIIPVIGVPIGSSPLNGLDALLSTAQMPGGISVASMAIGKAGAKNAGVLAVQIIALSDKGLTSKLKRYKTDLAKEVERKSKKLNLMNAKKI
ncbi:MAG: 5-(carboxyamino)imidazole ribonucleotide mutase [Candidatus Nitrohelix vancouverensis]|uniref:N5-carboxyaminoimidazole ribonucleotide mutase n=1 Tax=Candidatus Nitrohelix vancouverensis TaxID=2705534 RepID=A0A7T0C2R8_9BACT|nr:MAG: 5-(carboxyamino)imidazole ribonucleotide mutase [Candidatus Nitrohelix vancouverensis]